MTRTIVGVLRGGTSNEYGLSLKTGAAILNALPEEKYDVRDILIDRTGAWHMRGVPTPPARILQQIDVVLNAVHGGIGEDGTIQRILESAGVPYAGSRPLSAGFSLNKIRAREILQKAGLRMPQGVGYTLALNIDTGEMARMTFAQFGPPYIVKPPNDGAGHGIRIAQHITDLPDAIADVLDEYGSALVEEYLRGEELSVGIIEHFRDEDAYALPPAHVVRKGTHLSHDQHKSGELQNFAPSRFDYTRKESMMNVARLAHQALGLSHFSRSDFIVTPAHIYLLEVNSVPGLYPGASFPVMLNAVGSSVPEFLEHAIHLARTQR